MPSGSERLRQKFMVDGSDGIGECEAILAAKNISIDNFCINLPDGTEDPEVLDAVDYLVLEWDYGIT